MKPLTFQKSIEISSWDNDTIKALVDHYGASDDENTKSVFLTKGAVMWEYPLPNLGGLVSRAASM